mgnify:CR=1 FL=1
MDYKLIYINKMGFNHKGMATYEFIFCDDSTDLADVWGEGWENEPADGVAQPPDQHCIAKVGLIQCKDYELEVAHDSYYYSLSDAKDGIICLGYELIDETFQFAKRLVFHFGEDIKNIEAKLKERKLKLTYED